MIRLRFAAMGNLSAAVLAAAMLMPLPALGAEAGVAGQCPVSIDFRHPDIPAAFTVSGLTDGSRWTSRYGFVRAVLLQSFVQQWGSIKATGADVGENMQLRCEYRRLGSATTTDPRFLDLWVKEGLLVQAAPGKDQPQWRDVRTVATALDPTVGARYETTYVCEKSPAACSFRVHARGR